MRPLRIGVVGCGTIGSQICQAIDEGVVEGELIAVWDRNREKIEALCASLKRFSPQPLPPARMAEEVDLVVECASQGAVGELLPLVVEKGKEIMIMSVGGLVGREDLIERAKETGCRIYIPSGAIAGLDGVQSARVGEIKKVTLTTIKPPQGLKDAPYVKEKGMDLLFLPSATLIYEGWAREAVRLFPQNVNVAGALSLAGVGADRTWVRIIADPQAGVNTHILEMEGDFGRLEVRVDNLPSPTNPRTSFLAVLSAIALLQKITSPLKIG